MPACLPATGGFSGLRPEIGTKKVPEIAFGFAGKTGKKKKTSKLEKIAPIYQVISYFEAFSSYFHGEAKS